MSDLQPTFLDIVAAGQRIRSHVRRTPLEAVRDLDGSLADSLFFKLENWQRTGSFKARGAINRLLLLSAEERAAGVITASAGNHGLGVALAAEILGIAATIVVPKNAAPAKVAALRRYPVTLIEHGEDYDEAETHARRLATERGVTFVHAFEDPAVIAGQGTVGLEIMEELPQVATLVVPVGGGGLIAGVAIAAKSINPHVEVVGVQSEASAAMVRALEKGEVVETPIQPTIADGLAGRFVGTRTLELCQRYVDRVVTVSEESIRDAMIQVIRKMHILVEASAVVGLAALSEGVVRPASGPVAVVVTGRNVSDSVLREVLCTASTDR